MTKGFVGNMNSIKKFINVLSVVGLLSVSMVTPAAADSDTIQVKLNRQLVKDNTLHLLLEDVGVIAKAYQISLEINGNVKLDSLNFSNTKSDVAATYKYHKNGNTVDIYVTSKESLLNENDDLDIGLLAVTGTVGESFDVIPIKKSLKIVTVANTEVSLDEVVLTGGTDFTVSGKPDGGTTGKPDGGTDGKPESPVEVPVKNPNKLEGALRFGDLTSSYRAYKEISYLSVGKIVQGDKGRFMPDKQVTRAEAAAMIGRTLQLEGAKRKTIFKDVGASSFASGYIQSAVESGIISGYPDGTFRPNKIVNRGEMAIMISRAFDYKYDKTTNGAGEALMKNGISQGMTDGSFGSSLKLIRADMAVFLARAIDADLRVGNPTITFEGEKSVNVDRLTVRTGPSNDYSKASQLEENAKVSVGYEVGEWTLIKTGKGVIGFVPNSSLK